MFRGVRDAIDKFLLNRRVRNCTSRTLDNEH